MAAQTVSNLSAVMKQVWTADTLEKQFYAETPWLDRLEKTDRYTIGKEALVPIWSGRGGGTTVLNSAGGSLNAADAQRVDQGTYGLAYNYNPIKIELGALNQADGGGHSVADAIELEVTGAVSDVRKDVVRQALGNGDALIAQCTTSSSGQAVVSLLSTGYGYEAIVRGFLRPGQTVDIGTTASEGAVDADKVISSVTASSSAPTITLSSNLSNAVSSSHYVSIANARSGATSNEMIGLRTIYGSATTTIGGLAPASKTWWVPAQVDTTSTVMSLDIPLSLQQNVFQQTGKFPSFALTGIKQITNLYTILQNQVRFQQDMVRAGNVMSVNWNGLQVEAQPDCSDREFYLFDPSSLLICTGKYTKPTWASDIQGANTGLIYTVGQTNFQDTLVYSLGLAVKRRNSGAAATALTA